MTTDDEHAGPPPERARPSLDAQNSVLDTLAGKTGRVSRVNLRGDGSAHVSAAGAPPGARAELPEGRGNYKVLDEIARGGMGVVLRSHDADLGRDVAMKVLSEELADRPEVVQRFVEEAQIGGQLQHPGIVPVYELGLMADERPYFTMKLVKGQTLAKLLAARTAPEADRARLLSIFESICQTLAYAHSKGVIHRDLKPANVMVGAFGEVQVVDWGLAKVLGQGGVADELAAQKSANTIIETVRSGPGSSGSDSMAGSVLGTPAYMSPEQAMGELDKVDEHSDVFSLGAILCEILTGAPPYLDNEDERVVVQAARARLDPARARIEAAAADGELKELCLECLMPGQAARPRNAEEVAERVHAHLASLETRAHEALLTAERERIESAELRRRQRLTLALAGTVVVSLVALGGGLRWMEKQAEARRQEELAGVQGALDEARDRVAALQEENRLGEAVEVARAALARIEGSSEDVPEALERAERLVAQAAARVDASRLRADQSARNATLLARCEELRMRQIEANFGFTRNNLNDELDAAYAGAFRDYGVDLEHDDLPSVLEALRESGAGVEIALALDDWVPVRAQLHGAESIGVETIGALALDLDPDPARTRIREALASWDFERVVELARTEDLSALPASTIWVLSQGLTGLAFRGQFLASTAFWRTAPAREILRVVEQGVLHHPDDFLLNFRLGEVLGYLGRHDQAVRYLLVARALRPDNAAVHGVLGDALTEIGDSPAAKRAYLRAGELRQDFARIYRFAGQYAMYSGDYETALAAFALHHERSPDDLEAEIMREVTESFAGRLDIAEVADRAEASGRRIELDWTSWALCLHPDPDQRDAARSLRILEQLFPDGATRDSRFQYVNAYLGTGRPERALEVLESAFRLDPGLQAPGRMFEAMARARAHHMLGDSERARAEYAVARSLLEPFLAESGDDWAGSPLLAFCTETAALFGE